jgi:hypothetical protein
VDPWDPAYGLAFSGEFDDDAATESSARIDVNFEVPAADWRPLDYAGVGQVPETVLFLDGVRRIDDPHLGA